MSRRLRPPRWFPLGGGLLAALLAFGLWPAAPAQAAKSKITITQAAWFPKTQQLRVKAKNKSQLQTAELYDLNGRRLASASGAKLGFTLGAENLPTVPCAVRLQAGDDEALLPVKGAPKACAKAPTCSITAPAQGTPLKAGVDTTFQATAATRDRTALPLQYEWDFAGGAMGEAIPGSNPPAFKRPEGLNTTVQFVRDNSRYRVRFVATDAKGRRCEDAIEVVVGNPPTGLPPKVAEQEAPKLGSELAGTQGDVVVLPFEEWTFQNNSDMRWAPRGYGSFSPIVTNLRAYAFKKDRLPVFLGDDAVDLRFSAASNPTDPVGADSINSTSRNWPITAGYLEAVVQKTDQWEIASRPDTQKASNYFACSWMMTGYWGGSGCRNASGLPTPDEGYFKAKRDTATGAIVPDDPNNASHGLYMPGRENPYQSNQPQSFSKFVATEKSLIPGGTDKPAGWFSANLLPITDVDDQGRVNPYPLLRVEAVQKQGGPVLARTDAVLSNSRDFHCRECHTKGKVAANPNVPRTKAAFASSAFGKVAPVTGKLRGPTHRYWLPDDQWPLVPDFFDVSDFGGDPNSIADQEYAAALNYSSIHQFYDVYPFLHEMLYGISKIYLTEQEKTNPLGSVGFDTPRPCYGCHFTPLNSAPFGKTQWVDEEGWDVNNPAYAPNYSISMHRFHAELQWKDDAHTDIVRDENGVYVRYDWKTKGPHNSTKTRSLFPIFDDQGKQLPMEENCLRCHNGHREQLYRDRMYTAGVTCYDCHGDMLAVGQAFPKNYLQNKNKLGSFERDDYRLPWYDEPDCGSCHIGDGNQGKEKTNGFFSAGVLKTAFDPSDWSATTRPIDRNNPNSVRFAAAPVENFKASIPTIYYYAFDEVGRSFFTKNVLTKIDAPVFREGRDTHGNVACAACHGAAHAIWPNRDPSANDNVTALQLQGHTGTILECSVCHTADSFKNEADLDGGQYSGDAKPGILGGPHNLHPVNDPYWWKSTEGDTPNADGTTYGGWHNNYAKKPGAKGEDQCAACHGNDHKGTRLSKTPVDRTFDFRGLDFAKLKKAGLRKKVVTVAAGTPIGCDTCHSLELSFTGSPGR